MTDKVVFCGANSYEQKYYFNEEFQSLPQSVKMNCTLCAFFFTEDEPVSLLWNTMKKGKSGFSGHL